MHPDFHCSIIYNSEDVGNNLCPLTEEWIYVCTKYIAYVYV